MTRSLQTTRLVAFHASLLVIAGCAHQSSPVVAAVEQAKVGISADLKPFLESYFATWSAGDMDGYKAHFHPAAVVTLLRNGKIVYAIPRDEFVACQAEIVAGERMVERMTAFAADEDAQAASATAQWRLDKSDGSTTGVDRFTLIRDRKGDWKIVSLLFYVDG